MRISFKDRIRSTYAFYKALGHEERNSVVAVMHEDVGKLIFATNMNADMVGELYELAAQRSD